MTIELCSLSKPGRCAPSLSSLCLAVLDSRAQLPWLQHGGAQSGLRVGSVHACSTKLRSARKSTPEVRSVGPTGPRP